MELEEFFFPIQPDFDSTTPDHSEILLPGLGLQLIQLAEQGDVGHDPTVPLAKVNEADDLKMELGLRWSMLMP